MKFMNRTDLACETIENLEDKNCVIEAENDYKGIKVKSIDILKEGCHNKKVGKYYSIYLNDLDISDTDTRQDIVVSVRKCMLELFEKYEISKRQLCLIVGLGNKVITPDALGPNVAEGVFVTKHIFDMYPEHVSENYRPLCAIAPGVMGQTGIETYEIIESVVKKVQPDFLIVVDALASGNITKVNNVIQITDTGIHPGSGVGNKRKELSSETLGVPVFALGIPTVVDAASITSDALEKVLKFINDESNSETNLLVPSNLHPKSYEDIDMPPEDIAEKILGKIGILSEDEKREFISDVLTPSGLNMIVTPKDVDETIFDLSTLVIETLDNVLHN